MMLDAVIIVLREVLEAAMLASLLLAIGKLSGIRFFWFFFSVLVGLVGAYIYAHAMGWVSTLFEYTGQERVNGFIQIGTYLATLVVVLLLGYSQDRRPWSPLTLAMAVTVALAVTREGSEIMVYLQTFAFDSHKLVRVLTGGLVGACIGASIGVIVYFALVMSERRRALRICRWALMLVATGMLSQIVPLFEQADLIPSAQPVWDSSALVAETSVVGQLLYAVIGYEATPSAVQLAVYLLGMAVFAIILIISRRGSYENP